MQPYYSKLLFQNFYSTSPDLRSEISWTNYSSNIFHTNFVGGIGQLDIFMFMFHFQAFHWRVFLWESGFSIKFSSTGIVMKTVVANIWEASSLIATLLSHFWHLTQISPPRTFHFSSSRDIWSKTFSSWKRGNLTDVMTCTSWCDWYGPDWHLNGTLQLVSHI